MARPRIYLAGPDVFLPDAPARGAAMKAVCDAHGLDGVFPLDPLPAEPSAWAALPLPDRIARRNEAHIAGCHAIVANLVPFRGPGADPGTAYEIGFGRALGLPVFGWAPVAMDAAARVRAMPGASHDSDADGLQIEDFGLFENLMIACALSGPVHTAGSAGPWRDLAPFAACVAAVAQSVGAASVPAGNSRVTWPILRPGRASALP